MTSRRHIVAVLITLSLLSASFAPVIVARANAATLPGVSSAIAAATALPHVPTGDTIQSVIMTVLNGLAIAVAQAMVQKIVDSTITWANSGFEGKPAFVTDFRGTMSSTADSVAADFINGVAEQATGGSLCSPFQAQIALSLRTQYTQQYTPECSISTIKNNVTGLVGKLDDFYKDFNYGGWKTWLDVTQNSSNNPYGAYLDAQVELDSRIQNALGLKNQELQINDGFLSTKDCLLRNGNPPTTTVNIGGITAPAPTANYNSAYKPGECITYGPVKTPGTLIKDQLDKVLPSGLQQLVSVQDFDQLINAFMGGLLQKYVFNKGGLTSYKSSDQNVSNQGNTEQGPELQCVPNVQNATANDTVVSWSVLSAIAGTAEYRWTGDEIEQSTAYDASLGYASGTSVSLIYTTPSTPGHNKVMMISASTTDFLGGHRDIGPIACQQSVIVSRYKPLSVSCAPSVNHAAPDTPVLWTAQINGGSGQFQTIEWDGSQGHVPKNNDDASRMYPRDITDPTEPLIAWGYTGTNNSIFGKLSLAGNLYENGQAKDGVTIQTFKQTATTTYTDTLNRVYLRDAKPLGNVTASITVIDKDQSLPVVQVDCSGSVHIDDN